MDLVPLKQGSRGLAAPTVATLRMVIKHSVSVDLGVASPARYVRWLAGEPRERWRAPIGKRGWEMAAEGEQATDLTAIQLLLLTDFRRLECVFR